MGIDIIENVCTLLVVIFGTLYSLFKYVKTPLRGWLYISIFFLTHLLSDYYWTTYFLVIGEDPDVSALMAYFGWNVGYLVMLLMAIKMRPDYVKGSFNLLMLLPIPLNIWQFFIYIQYGGIFNNIWEGVLATGIACICLQVILHYFMHRAENVAFPYFHVALALFILFEYGMWTSSCYDWSWAPVDPYYVFSFLECGSLLLLAPATDKEYAQRGCVKPERSVQETRFTILLQATIAVIIFFGGVGGYSVGVMMKNALPKGASDPGNYKNIAITLFVISIVLVLFIMMIITMTAMRYKAIERNMPEDAAIKRGRFNFVLTIVITLSLMIISVIYTSRLFYKVAVTGVIENGQNRVYSTSEELENYIGVARSILWVTADTVDIMLETGSSQQNVLDYITDQTKNQSEQFDENFTGLYAYVNGEYLDGSGWVPPADYDVEVRDWYKNAVDANGNTIIVNPYVDMQTGSLVITICKLIDNRDEPGNYEKRDVVALDLVVNHVQEVTEDINIGGKGFGFVVNKDGMIIAHPDRSLNGSNIEDIYGTGLIETITENCNSSVKARLENRDCTLFIDSVINQWYVVIAISDNELFAESNGQLAVNIVVSLLIFLLISFFYYLGYKNEQLNARKMEDMRSADMRHEYEAQVLKQKETAANEANKAKSQFLAQMSHEIRTPINAVLGMNEMILRTSKDEQTLEYANNIDSAGNILLALINTILDFSKIEDGKMDIIPVNYDTSSFILDLINSIKRRAETKGLELIPEIDESIPCKLFGDDVRLKQVIVNLLTNAVKYTETGSVWLTMKNVIIDGDKLKLYVSVRDTGIGIKPEDIDRLSLSFQRFDEKKNRNIEGTGLGMSIVTNLLNLMGSRICVQSTYGEGSNFYFVIEQGIVDRTPIGDFAKNLENRKKERTNEDLISAPGARVLVVDDNNLNLMVAKSLLKLCNIFPDAVASGREAINLMGKKSYDIVFLDHMMPGMDGIETLHELEECSLIPTGTKMIVLTANAVVGAKENYLREGFDDYLSKPIELKNLVEQLKKYLPKTAYEHVRETEAVTVNTEKNKQPEKPEYKPIVFDDDAPVYDIERLKEAGMDTETGLAYCAGDPDTFFEVLSVFTSDYESKSSNFKSYYESENWHDYDILIHALKGNLRAIGMQELAEKAFALEKAAKEGDADYIKANHEAMMEEYRKINEVICEAAL
ncbi:Signal transduction histidine kinase [Butyrivibrio sp. ob235]|uniref:hybrid sensor histidine kinase/response regulator n=1 Tax=Butyrivibrio sp. ob235 TaxID=1761780 RepID=UPI0008B6666C|nr:hybrid sensor histidine kinase/response regulator [Butyrivibrio sp. ob235]SEL21744.1 Signal transduction histidine kinase [Butyrivibrio sp. ob235]